MFSRIIRLVQSTISSNWAHTSTPADSIVCSIDRTGSPRSLQDVLETAGTLQPSPRLIIYSSGNTSVPFEIEYSALYREAVRTSRIVHSLPGFHEGCPVLLHLENHWETLLWFWAVLFANGLPVLSTPFSNVDSHREKHLRGLSSLLHSPLTITSTKFESCFANAGHFKLYTHESLRSTLGPPGVVPPPLGATIRRRRHHSDLALLMLTSGSTGGAKAVKLEHQQIIEAVSGKSSVRRLPPNKPFLNWVGIDHVAALVEIHIQALFLGVDQIHLQAADLMSSPRLFLDTLSRHQVSRSFAPNFFLAKLIATAPEWEGHVSDWDLSNLTVLASGGEANDVDICQNASLLLSKYGAPKNVITPGFGMTETCAGAIFNLDCPGYDKAKGYTSASLGKCMKGIELRIRSSNGQIRSGPMSSGETGELEVRGSVVFKGYYGNDRATAEAFTSDGWFKTGDLATLDSYGNLRLVGRIKDCININGVKINCTDVQSWIDHDLRGLVRRAVVFPSRTAGMHTETITVAYVPMSWPTKAEDIVKINSQAVNATVLCSGHTPLLFPILDETMLPPSSLGKISRAKMRSMFENGMFDDNVAHHKEIMDDYKLRDVQKPETPTQASLIEEFAAIANLSPDVIGIDTSLFDIGFASMDLVRLKHAIDSRLGIEISVIALMKNPTASAMAQHIEDLLIDASSQTTASYDPIVPLRSEGHKSPLWLIHPGVGEVLVFVGLAQQLSDDDRPIYALRARGFEPGQRPFDSVEETVDVYTKAIREKQPEGPYALAGYSYGSMLAFEVAKILEGEHHATVQFLGSFNLPPHIKPRMRQLNWNLCLMHLAFFLGLVTEDYSDSMECEYGQLSQEDATAKLFQAVNRSRMNELGLEDVAVKKWACIAYGLQSMATDYEPRGTVSTMDIFHARPLKAAAESREDWLENHLSKWKDYCSSAPKFHKVKGAHYTMIGPEYVAGFAKTLKGVLRERGV